MTQHEPSRSPEAQERAEALTIAADVLEYEDCTPEGGIVLARALIASEERLHVALEELGEESDADSWISLKRRLQACEEALRRYENEAPDWLKPIARAALDTDEPAGET